MTKLTVADVQSKFSDFDFDSFHKPGRNKGERGQLIEIALGVGNSSNLRDLIDGELKTFTIGESIAVTQLKHCLQEIIENGKRGHIVVTRLFGKATPFIIPTL